MNELITLRIRNAIAAKEWITACANHDMARFGSWQRDWVEWISPIDIELDRLFEAATADQNGAGKEGRHEHLRTGEAGDIGAGPH